MNRNHGRNIPRAQYFPWQWRLVVQPQACVAEKWSLTNRIRSHSARIKAAEQHRYQLWLAHDPPKCERFGDQIMRPLQLN
jgi:hypothetical protein